MAQKEALRESVATQTRKTEIEEKRYRKPSPEIEDNSHYGNRNTRKSIPDYKREEKPVERVESMASRLHKVDEDLYARGQKKEEIYEADRRHFLDKQEQENVTSSNKFSSPQNPVKNRFGGPSSVKNSEGKSYSTIRFEEEAANARSAKKSITNPITHEEIDINTRSRIFKEDVEVVCSQILIEVNLLSVIRSQKRSEIEALHHLIINELEQTESAQVVGIDKNLKTLPVMNPNIIINGQFLEARETSQTLVCWHGMQMRKIPLVLGRKPSKLGMPVANNLNLLDAIIFHNFPGTVTLGTEHTLGTSSGEKNPQKAIDYSQSANPRVLASMQLPEAGYQKKRSLSPGARGINLDDLGTLENNLMNYQMQRDNVKISSILLVANNK